MASIDLHPSDAVPPEVFEASYKRSVLPVWPLASH